MVLSYVLATTKAQAESAMEVEEAALTGMLMPPVAFGGARAPLETDNTSSVTACAHLFHKSISGWYPIEIGD